MGTEMEVKVLNIDKKEIEKRLIKVGAKLVKKEYQVNTIFDTDNRMIKNNYNGYLRIREKKDLINNINKYILTLKKNVSKDEVRKNVEIETYIDNKKDLTEIFEHLKLHIKHEGTKERISYRYEDILFEIDTWDKDTYPYPYLEIEVKDKKSLKKAIKLISIDEKNVTTKSLAQLRMELGMNDL